MKKIFYISITLFAVSIAALYGAAFSSGMTNAAFTYSTPTSGTLSCDVSSSGGGLKSVKNASGSFTVAPQDSTICHVFSEVTGDSSKVTVTWRGNYIVDTSSGDITSSSLTVTKYIKRKDRYRVSTSASGTGTYDTINSDSTTGSMDGNF